MNFTGEELTRITSRHRQHVCANGHRPPGICVRCKQGWPCDAARLLDLAASALNFTVVWRETFPYLPEDYECHLQCAEAEAAADLYRMLGDEKMADLILDNHAVHDTEEEQHHERGVEVQLRRAAAGQ